MTATRQRNVNTCLTYFENGPNQGHRTALDNIVWVGDKSFTISRSLSALRQVEQAHRTLLKDEYLSIYRRKVGYFFYVYISPHLRKPAIFS